MSKLELITLPIRTAVLLFLLWLAYFYGFGNPLEEWRRETTEDGVVAKYSRDGRDWRIFYDRNRDREWDMWIDERGGPPLIVDIDDDFDGRPDRHEDELGQPLSTWRGAGLRAQKTFGEFFRNPRQLQYTGLAFMLYILMEFAIRWATASRDR
jgi:hypothetical protein